MEKLQDTGPQGLEFETPAIQYVEPFKKKFNRGNTCYRTSVYQTYEVYTWQNCQFTFTLPRWVI